MFPWFPMLKSLTQKLICINLVPAQGQQARCGVLSPVPSLPRWCRAPESLPAFPLDPCGARIKIQIVVLRTDPHSSDLTTHCIGRNDFFASLVGCHALCRLRFPLEPSPASVGSRVPVTEPMTSSRSIVLALILQKSWQCLYGNT